MMDRMLSNKLKIASLICTLMVIFRHSLNMVAFYGGEKYAAENVYTIETCISILTEIAVPYFFLVSGFFFFRTDFYSSGTYINMLAKKGMSLLLPFVIWNIIGAIILFAAGELPVLEKWSDYFWGLVLSKYDVPLWYVRNLMMMTAVVPLYYWIFKIDKWHIYTIVGIGLLLWWWPVDCAWWSTEGWLYFFLGGVLQRFKRAVEWKMPVGVLVLLTVVWLSFCFFRPKWCIPMNKATTLMGIICFWQLLNYTTSVWNRLLPMAKYSFFIYVLHIYVIKTMKVTLASQFPENEVVALIAYFVLPFVTFGMLLWVGKVWNSVLPMSFGVITGGRG